MRTYQIAMKMVMNARLMQTQEDAKENFTAVFSTNEEAIAQIKTELKQTLRRIQEISTVPRQTTLCQLNIDLLKWI